VWARLLPEHAALQRRLQRYADDAVAVGVPDLRPSRLPAELDALLSRTTLEDRLRRAVLAARPVLAEHCAALTHGPVAATVQHDDFHDGNVTVDTAGAARVIDWGDSSVGHPFGVLLVTLRVLRHRGTDEDVVRRAQDAYLDTWSDLADAASLRALAAAAVQVQALARALSWERALLGADEQERAEHGDPVAGWLEVLTGGVSGVRG
jgi:aminoglycoside phosphotransferase (APT) family kinase protein